MIFDTVPVTLLVTGYFDVALVQGLSNKSRYARLILCVSRIDFLNLHFHFLAEREHFAGMLDPVPTHLADVNHPVDAAQIDKRAEIANVAHHSLAHLAHLQLRQQFFFGLGLLALQNRRGG